MCTIGYHKDLNLIFKNRDKAEITSEEVIVKADYIATRTKGADYFSCGVNKYECGFVSAAINTPRWVALVYEGKIQKANEQFRIDNQGLNNPMILVSEMLPNAKNINEIIDKIQSSDLKWMGYNVLLADTEQASVMETYSSNIYIRKLNTREVVTNHLFHLKYGPKNYSEYSSSFKRYEYGNNSIKSTSSITDLFDMLKPEDEEKRKEIWRTGAFKTISSSIIDLEKGLVYYSKGLNEDYSVLRKE